MKHRYLLGTLLILVVFWLISSPPARLESSRANLSSLSNDNNNSLPAIAEFVDSAAVVTETVQIEEAGQSYVLHLPLIAAGNANASTTIIVAPDQGGKLVANDGMVTVDVPVGAVASETMISYRQLSEREVSGYQTVGSFFELTAFDVEGNPIAQFNGDLTFTVSYDELFGLDENGLDLYYSSNDVNWHVIPSEVNSQADEISAHVDQVGSFVLLAPEGDCDGFEVGIGDDVPAYVTDAFIAAYSRNGGEEVIGLPCNDVHDWGGAWIQDFSNDNSGIIYNAGRGTAYYVAGSYMTAYFDNSGPNGFLGLPTSDRYEPPSEALLLDKHTDFMSDPIQEFAEGFIGNDINGSHGSGYKAFYFYPALLGAQVQVEHYEVPHPDPPPDDPDATITKARVTLTAGEVDLPHENMSVDGIWIESDTDMFRGWVPSQGTEVWEDLEPEGDFSFRLEGWVANGLSGGQAGYLPCDSYKKQQNGEEYLESIPLTFAGFYTWGYECEGFGGGGYIVDSTPPVITHSRQDDVWQNGKGWAIISAEVTDNVGVAWVKVTLNGEEYPMTLAEGNTYVAIVQLQFGRNSYFITAADTSGNTARHPESGEEEIWSEFAFSYGHRPWMAYSDDPVNSGIGNFVYHYTDAEIPALGPDIVIERWFNHQSRYDGPLGIGWTFLYDMRLLIVDNLLFSGAELRYADGRVVNFEGDGAGGFTTPETVQDMLEKAGSDYLLTMKDKTVYRFNADGRLISIADKDGNTLTLNYSGEEFSTIVDASGRVLSFTYADGDITSINIPDYGTVQYAYENGRLISVTGPEDDTVLYTYDDIGCILSITSPEGKPFLAEQSCDEDGRVTYQLGGTGYVNEFIYDDENRTTTIIDPYGNPTTHVYDEEYRVIENRDALGNSVTYTYNEDYLPLTTTDKNGHTTSYTYDDNGNRLTATDVLGNVTTYTYDADNNLTSRTDALGHTTSYEYDAEGHLIREIDPLGSVTEHTYNAEGVLIRTVDALGNATETIYNDLGLPIQVTNALGHVSSMTYDDAGRLLSEIDAEGNTTTYEYNNLGFVVSVTDPEGYLITHEYDTDHNLIEETNADGYSKSYTYDDNNRLVAETDWAGNLTTYVYDDLARQISEIDPLGHATSKSYDAVGNLVVMTDTRGATTTYTYNANGNVLTETDALGQSTSYTYDELNRVVEVSSPCACASRVERTVYDELSRMVTRIDPLGNETHFEYDELGRQIRQIDALGNETGRGYDLEGHLISQIDAFGQVTQYEYDAVYQQVKVINRAGYATTNTYDKAGRLVAVTDERGHTTSNIYDDNSRLISQIDPLGGVTAYTYNGRGNRLTTTDAAGRVTSQMYDANSNLISTTNPRGYTTTYEYDALNRKIQMTDALGSISTYTYDPAGALLSETNPAGYTRQTTYDILGRTIAETDRNGNTYSFEYDPAGNLIRTTDALGGETTTTYDANNNQLTSTNALGHTTTFEYNALNRQVTIIDPFGAVSTKAYDARGSLIEIVDANGHATRYSYDVEQRQISVIDALDYQTRYEYDAAGNLIKETDRNGHSTLHTYDGLNRPVHVVNARAHTQTTLYDAVGNVIEKRNFRDHLTLYEYDPNNNLVRQTDALGGQTTTQYDALDRKIAVADANQHITRYAYDVVGNLLSIIQPGSQLLRYDYDAESNQISFSNAKGRVTVYGYDALNRQIAEADPLGHITRTEYDAIGQKIGTIDAENNETSFTYDPLGRLLTVTDPLTHTTRYTYDAVGNRLSKIDANYHQMIFEYDALNQLVAETNPVGQISRYAYDPEGNLVEYMNANGQLITYDFDAINQVIAIDYPDSSQDVSFEYDANGNMTEMIDAIGSTLVSYDPLDREVSKTDPYGYELQNSYDGVSNRTAITYPDGSQATYRYNVNNWLIEMTDPVSGTTTYDYDPEGLPIQTTLPNGTWTDRVYDHAGRLVQQFNGTTQNPGLVMAYDYTLDAVGNRLQTLQRYTDGQIRTITTIYQYNARYELLEAVEEYEGPPANIITTSYTYDPVGNRLSMTTNRDQATAVTTLYTYDAASHLLSAGDVTYTYDANGNRLTKLTPGGQNDLESYQYDAENRLSLYTRTQNGQIKQRVYNAYDGLGRRLNKGTQVSSGTIKWVQYALDGLSYDQLAEFPQTGSPNVTQLYRGLYNELISMDEIQDDGSGSQYWFASDGLGSVAATTKQQGESAHEYFYDPYGQIIDENGQPEDSSSWTDPDNHYLLTGKEWDEESTFYYFGARFYDAQVGVWITPDPYRGEANIPLTLHPYFYLGHNPPNQANNPNNPMSLHRYLYVQNNPLNRIDINGYSACGPYAKCQKSEDPLLKFLFGITHGWEINFDLWERVGSHTKKAKDQLVLPGFETYKIEMTAIIGISVQDTREFIPSRGRFERCKAVNGYGQLEVEGTFPIPGATYGLANAVWGVGGNIGVQGELKGCVSDDIDINGKIDYSIGFVSEANLALTGQLYGFVRGETNVFVAEASVETGIRVNIEYPLIGCKLGGEVSLRKGYIKAPSCLNDQTTKVKGNLELYAEARAETFFGGDYFNEKSWRLLEGELFEAPTLLGWAKKLGITP